MKMDENGVKNVLSSTTVAEDPSPPTGAIATSCWGYNRTTEPKRKTKGLKYSKCTEGDMLLTENDDDCDEQ